MSGFIKWLKKHVCEDDAWITVHPNASGPGSPVLLDDEGYIKGGMGGKFTGQRIDLMPRKSGYGLPVSENDPLNNSTPGFLRTERYSLKAPASAQETSAEQKTQSASIQANSNDDPLIALYNQLLTNNPGEQGNAPVGKTPTKEMLSGKQSLSGRFNNFLRDESMEDSRNGTAARAEEEFRQAALLAEKHGANNTSNLAEQARRLALAEEEIKSDIAKFEATAKDYENNIEMRGRIKTEREMLNGIAERLADTRKDVEQRETERIARRERYGGANRFASGERAALVSEVTNGFKGAKTREELSAAYNKALSDAAARIEKELGKTGAGREKFLSAQRAIGQEWKKAHKKFEKSKGTKKGVGTTDSVSMSFDAAPSQRRVDENGFMHVDSCHITKEQVVKYYGREIPGWRELGLDPERLYNVFRPGDEIEKAATTFDGLPLQLQHHIDSADEPQTEFRVGSISRPVWRAPYLDCDLHITNGAAISAVEHGDFKEISAAYLYEPVIESGEFDGTPYEIVMRNLRGNHVALVPKGRAGADVVVADEAPDAPPLRSFAAWMRKNPLSLKDAPSLEWEATRNALDNN